MGKKNYPRRGKQQINKEVDHKKPRTGKEYRSGFEAGESTEKYDRYKSVSNDWKWYAENEQLVKDVASYPFAWPVGTELSTGIPFVDNHAIPGIMCIYTSPAVGYADTTSAPINTAARNIYSYVRHANSGHTNYEAPDLMMYLLAMDSIYSFISYAKRIYGVMNLYTYENRYYPDALLTAMGVSPEDFRTHIADFRAFVNTLVVRVGSMAIPASMSYMARHMWMYEGIYVDSDTPKAQTYLYSPAGFYISRLDKNGLGMLHYVPLQADGSTLLTYEQFTTYALAMIEPILASEDYNIMSGDILKAFGESGIYKGFGISEEYQVLPSYNKEVLSQIENATLLTAYLPDTAFDPTVPASPDIYQVIVEDATQPNGPTGYLRCVPRFKGIWEVLGMVESTVDGKVISAIDTIYGASKIINSHEDMQDPKDVMVMTRLTNTLEEIPDEDLIFYTSKTCGSDVAHYARIFYYGRQSSPGLPVGDWELRFSHNLYHALECYTQGIDAVVNTTPDEIAQMSSGNLQQILEDIIQNYTTMFNSSVNAVLSFAFDASLISMFDWHPAFVPIGFLQSDSATITAEVSGNDWLPTDVTWEQDTKPFAPGAVGIGQYLMDIDKYTVIAPSGLERMSQIALLSEFNVPQMGMFSRKMQ